MGNLKKKNIRYIPNYEFEYPNELGEYYLDLFFNNMEVEDNKVKTSLFETDIVIFENKVFEDDNFSIWVDLTYIVKCKSRSNPPINYIVFPLKYSKVFSQPYISFYGSAFYHQLFIEANDLLRTERKPVGIKLW